MPVPGPCGCEWSQYIKTLLYLDICLFQDRLDMSDRSTSKHYCTSIYACFRVIWMCVIVVHQNMTVPRHMPVPGPCGCVWSQYIKTLLYLDICPFQGRVNVNDRSTPKHYWTSTYASSRAVWMCVISVHQNITVLRHMPVPGPCGCVWSQYIKILLYFDICLFQGRVDVSDRSTSKHKCTSTYACSRAFWMWVIAVHQNITVPRHMPVPGRCGCVWSQYIKILLYLDICLF